MTEAENAAFAAMQTETEAPPAPEPGPPAEEPAEDAAPQEGEESGDAEPRENAAASAERPPQFVPHGALAEERRIRQQLEADNRRYAEERARIDERLRIIEEMNRPAPPPEPDENVDPIGTIQYLRKELTDLKQQWARGSQQWTAEQQAVAEARQIASIAEQDAQAFKAQAPDYGDAFQHWAGSRHAELASYGMSPQDAAAQLEQEQFDIARSALQRGISPAAHLYHIAKTRGYAGKPASNGNGRAAPDGASAEIQRVAAGQQRSPTLSGTGGGAVPTEMTASRLATMSKDDFADWIARNPKKADRLMGFEPKGRR
jgi:hypothetical protein